MAVHAIHFLASFAWAPLIIFGIVASLAQLTGWNRLRAPWFPFSIAICAVMIFTATAYLFVPILLEDAETDIACISALAMRGEPIYPGLDAGPRYILLYGPLTYLAHLPFYLLFGKTLFSFKLLGYLSFLTSLLGLYGICRRYATPRDSLIGTGCVSVVLFRYIGVEFWGRIDPLILALTVLSICITVWGPQWAVILCNAMAIAAIPNLKLSGVAYLLPAVGLIFLLKSWKTAGFAIALATLLFPLPFLLPNVSLSNYAGILKLATAHGIVLDFLIRNVQYSCLLMLPIVLALRSTSGPRRSLHKPITFAVLIGIGLTVTSIFGAKSGAGSYHLLPYVAPILQLYFWVRSEPASMADSRFRPFAPAWIITTLFLSSAHLQSVIHEFRRASEGRKAVAEIEATARNLHGRTFQVGVGSTFDDPRTRYAYIPTFAGQPYTISGAAIRDLQLGGVAIPDSTIQDLISCRTNIWLIPKGDEPFTASNSYYDTPHPAFEGRFIEAFRTHYHKIAAGSLPGSLYDTWSCQK